MNFDTVKHGDSFELIVEDHEDTYIVVIMTPVKGFMFFPRVEAVTDTLKAINFIGEDHKFELLMIKMKSICDKVNATTTFYPISQSLVDTMRSVFEIDLLEFTTIPEPEMEEAHA